VKRPADARDLLLVFGTVQRVMRAERTARDASLDVDVIPAPRSVSSECGVVLEARRSQVGALGQRLREADLEPKAVYRVARGAWLPTSLEAADLPDPPALTQQTAYGGCGAKLAKGLLENILCGLPRLESDDLLVGIEFADDAGVVRVRDDLAIIHTTDFFPPMVDDPYSFGRIAAVNALSDVFAMGGKPLAAMNLVSFPLVSHDKMVLKEILRGGLEALEEAGAVLAGGHTIEGQELLYGLAVTGTVHPDRIWRNQGVRPGDALVLTKPLGTGIITTAAKAELIEDRHLGTAIRWMGTMNQEAARAAQDARPSAVTDVTGFGLAGHAAEMAAASGVEIVIEIADLPLLPGSHEGAAQGLVPAGAAKNRESVGTVVDIPSGVDPFLVDLIFDPQTSGGLLVACDPDRAAVLARRLPAAAVIGHAAHGEAGMVRVRMSSTERPGDVADA